MLVGKLRREPVRTADQEEPDLKLPPQEERPERQEDIVEGDREHRRELAAPEEPGHQHREQRLEPQQRSEPKDHADGHTPGNRVRSVANLREPVSEVVNLEREKFAKPAHLT